MRNRTEIESAELVGLALPDFVREYADVKISSELIINDRDPEGDEIVKLRSKIGEMFNIIKIEMTDSPDEQREVLDLLLKARKKLSRKSDKISQSDFLNADEAYSHAVVIWGRHKYQGLIVRRMVWVVLGVVIFYAFLLTVLSLLNLNLESGFLGIPPLVIIWGGIGGITAVLFRHRSTIAQKWPFDFRWLWIVVRPLLGMIMGAFIYLAVVSGLLVFGSQPNIDRPQLLWGIAFIGGVSDRLWELLINTALGTFGQSLDRDKQFE